MRRQAAVHRAIGLRNNLAVCDNEQTPHSPKTKLRNMNNPTGMTTAAGAPLGDDPDPGTTGDGEYSGDGS